MDFLVDLKKKTTLRQVDDSEKADRSLANTKLAGKDNLDDEAERWKYFFDSGCSAWFEDIKAHTFTSSFCTIAPAEAQIIVNHWEQRGRACEEKENDSTIDLLFEAARSKLEPLRERLETAMSAEVALSPVGLVFVKLSTRSPKDSKKAFAKAKDVYFQRLQELISRGEGEETNANTRWRILCEETTRSGAVSTSSAALELLLDSDRVYEDLEYALRGPPLEPSSLLTNSPQRHWNMDLVARAWDPRLKPESEFRGICWGGVLTCLCQYYHPLYFTVLEHLKDQIERDIRAVFSDEKVCSAVAKLGGHCIIDFAWLGPNTKVIIVELNPFDGVCLGTFPASTGLFLWDVPEDRAVMRGEKPFEFRIRTTSLDDTALKAQCNPDWRDLIYSGNSGNVVTADKEV